MLKREITSNTLLASKSYDSPKSLLLRLIEVINIYTILTIVMIFHALIFTKGFKFTNQSDVT